MSPRPAQLNADLDEIIEIAGDDIRAFAGTRMFITGGTGFVGTWLAWSIVEANRRLGTRINIDILTRDSKAFAGREPEIVASPGVQLLQGDVVDPLPTSASYDAIIHAATPASATLLAEAPQTMLDIILAGGRNIAALAERSGAIPVLFTSSGAIYGRIPPSIELVDETYTGGPDPTDPFSAYHEGKRCGELTCAISAHRSGGRAILTRLFAFVGPYLPLERHLAIGNFIQDRVAGRPIHVAGDGTSVRSYMYATDMVNWLWAAFARGTSRRAYNIGSEEAVTIGELANRIATIEDPFIPVHIAQAVKAGTIVHRYVPSTQRIRDELSVRPIISFDEAVNRTLRYLREVG